MLAPTQRKYDCLVGHSRVLAEEQPNRPQMSGQRKRANQFRAGNSKQANPSRQIRAGKSERANVSGHIIAGGLERAIENECEIEQLVNIKITGIKNSTNHNAWISSIFLGLLPHLNQS